MEEAKISEKEREDGVQQGIPSLVTDDDLKREIGEWVVSGLNKDILIRRLVQQNNSLRSQTEKMIEELKQIEQLKLSNIRLTEKNKALADVAEAGRQELKEEVVALNRSCDEKIKEVELDYKSALEELSIIQKALTDEQEVVKDKNKEIGILKGKCTRLEKKLEV